jgi:hypothetical protein
MQARASGGSSPLRREGEHATPLRRATLTCSISVRKSIPRALASDTTSPLRKHAPYGRPVHRLGDCAGRSPGSRVGALRPAFPVSQWPCRTRARRLQLRGQPRINCDMQHPCSLFPPRLAPRNQHGQILSMPNFFVKNEFLQWRSPKVFPRRSYWSREECCST